MGTSNTLESMMKNFSIFYFMLITLVPLTYCLEDEHETRKEKLISTFQIVRFPNDVCVGSNSRNGTCYTSAECSDKDGTSSGSCADGFGVCCTFVIATCGSSSSENNTYWTQPTSTTGPSTVTNDQVLRHNGQPVSMYTNKGRAVSGNSF